MTADPGARPERVAFTTLVASLLCPMIAHGLWRPLEHGFGAAGTAREITGVALAIALLTGAARWFAAGRPGWLLVLPGALTAVALSVGLALGVAGLGALLPVALAAAALLHWLPGRLPPALDGLARRHRVLTALYALGALASIVATARVTVFIGDPTAVEYQALPGDSFVETHSCLTAYVRASELARQGADNLYADHWWHGSNGLPPLAPGVENPYRPFLPDNFSYPPSFLLIASALAPLDGDFLAQRALWFGMNAAFVAFGLWVVARWLDGPAAHRVLLLAPLLLGSMPVLVTLQIGNFHLAALVLSILAMVALDRRRVATGGALLATAILSKISPGILGVVLLARGRGRDAAVAAGFGGLLLALSTVVFGVEPLRSFVTFALPRLQSGRAFPFLDTEAGIVTNMSPFGIPFKLALLGYEEGDPWTLGPRYGAAYTLALLVVTVVGARRSGDRRDQAIRWMALLVLAALQSPFCAAYSMIGLLWATTLLSPEVTRVRHGVALFALWPAMLFVPPGLGPAALAVLNLAHTALTVGVAAWLVVRPAPRPLGSEG